MNPETRSKNAIRNIIIGGISQLIILLLSFVNRTVFVQTLGAEYLGVNGLYTNILSVLSLAELGIGNVMIYSLYKPIADRDKAKIFVLLRYYKKIYRIIAIVVFCLGICVIPILGIIVNSELPEKELKTYYYLYLLNSVFSYFAIYKTTLINADQKIYLVKTVSTIIHILVCLSQIFLLISTKNFTLYLIAIVSGTLLTNIILSLIVNRMYPFTISNDNQKHDSVKLDLATFKNNIKSAFLYKIGIVIMNNTDNILISIMIGTVFVGYYSNYSLLIVSVGTFIGIIIQGIFSSVGNLNASETLNRSYKIFNVALLLFHWISSICAICFFVVLNDFVTIWIGEKYLLETKIVLSMILVFYIQNAVNPVWIFRETMGLFQKIKYIMLIAAAINLILSIILGSYWGLAGILLSTAIARIVTTIWYEPIVLYRTKFNKHVNEYWRRQTKYFLITIIVCPIAYGLTFYLPISLSFIFIKIVICFCVVCIAYILATYKTEEFYLLKEHGSRLFLKKRVNFQQ